MLSETTVYTSWAPNVWSFIDNNTNDDEEEEDLDTDSLLNAREVATLQLQDLFGQDLFDFDTSDSPYYDEFTFVPNQTQNSDSIIQAPKRRRSSTSSLSSYESSFSGYSEEEEYSYHTDSIDSDHEEEVLERRRILEEVILEKITNQLDSDKLSGILTIISSQEEEDEAEEVEIDLARLDMHQLSSILLYIDACLLQEHKQQGHIVSGELHNLSESPMSSVMESDSEQEENRKKRTSKKRKNNKKSKKSSNEQMDLAVTQNQTIVHKQPKRRQSIIIQSTPQEEEEEATEDDELIDIMV